MLARRTSSSRRPVSSIPLSPIQSPIKGEPKHMRHSVNLPQFISRRAEAAPVAAEELSAFASGSRGTRLVPSRIAKLETRLAAQARVVGERWAENSGQRRSRQSARGGITPALMAVPSPGQGLRGRGANLMPARRTISPRRLKPVPSIRPSFIQSLSLTA
jgi:hypothetical protein